MIWKCIIESIDIYDQIQTIHIIRSNEELLWLLKSAKREINDSKILPPKRWYRFSEWFKVARVTDRIESEILSNGRTYYADNEIVVTSF
ncbi:MAG: hypothetical protein NTNFB02_00390 [Nitrospira sp.]